MKFNYWLLGMSTFLSSLFLSCTYHNNSAEGIVEAPLATTDTQEMIKDTSHDERTIIKTATIDLHVSNINQSVKNIQQVVQNTAGHIYHYEIKNTRYEVKTVRNSMDSSWAVQHITPEAVLKVKVPKRYADTFITQMINMHATITNLLVDEEDVTENIQQKRELNNRYVHTLKAIAKNETQYKTDVNEAQLETKYDYAELKYRTEYLWFDITMQAMPYIEKVNISTEKDIHIPIGVQAVVAVQNGFYYFSQFLIGLLYVLPFILFVIMVVYGVKKYFRKKSVVIPTSYSSK